MFMYLVMSNYYLIENCDDELGKWKTFRGFIYTMWCS